MNTDATQRSRNKELNTKTQDTKTQRRKEKLSDTSDTSDKDPTDSSAKELTGGTMHVKPIIAIDGPAGSGKSTAAKNLANAFGLRYLDTGAMYRAVTWKAMQDGITLADEDALAELAGRIDIKLEPDGETTRVVVDGVEITQEIRREDVTREVHHIARSPRVREKVVALQKKLGEGGGVVAEGRDIGTVVFPNAELKIFLVADTETRAARRHKELLERGEKADYSKVLDDIRTRDRRDSEREASPLRQAEDAVVVDTSGNSIEDTLAELAGLVRKRFPQLSVREKAQGG